MYSIINCCLNIYLINFLINLEKTECALESISKRNTTDVLRSSRPCNRYENSECRQNEICFYGNCECEPNYKRNKFHVCKHFDCKTDIDCQSYDKKRECHNGECICKNYLQEDDSSYKCENVCSTNSHCGVNQVCFENSCDCAPNYQWSKDWKECVFRRCSEDRDCWYSGDTNRECRDTQCVCEKYYREDSFTRRCKYSYNSLVYVCLLLIIPVLTSICAVFYCRRKRLQRRAQQSSDTISCPHAVNHAFDPPPPPYQPPPPYSP